MKSLPSVCKSSTRSPVKLEWAGCVWDHGAIEGQCLGSSLSSGEVDKAVASIAIDELVIKKDEMHG